MLYFHYRACFWQTLLLRSLKYPVLLLRNASIRAIAESLMEEDKEDRCTFCIGKKRIWAQQNPDGKVFHPEENLNYLVHGWPKLARLMAQNADLQKHLQISTSKVCFIIRPN